MVVRNCFFLLVTAFIFNDAAYAGIQSLNGYNNGTSNTSTALPQTTKHGPTSTPEQTTTTSSHNATSTAKPTDDCSLQKTCDDCIDNYKCFWCGSSKKCETWPKNRITPNSCSGNKWYWKQCTVPGYILIIVVPILGVLILVTCACCIYCKCCRVKSKNMEQERIRRRREDMKEKHEERKRDRQTRSDLIRQKYGLLKSEDEEPLL